MIEILKRSWAGILTGSVIAYVATRVEPFRSRFTLAVFVAIGLGILSGLVEVGVRRLAGSRKS